MTTPDEWECYGETVEVLAKKPKDYEPLTLGGLYQTDWEDLMWCLDQLQHIQLARALKYNLQCKIDMAIMDGDWV